MPSPLTLTSNRYSSDMVPPGRPSQGQLTGRLVYKPSTYINAGHFFDPALKGQVSLAFQTEWHMCYEQMF